MNEDTRLIAESLAGDRSAFGQLVRAYQDRLFHTLVHLTGSFEEAEDVVQETFVQAFTKLSSYQGRAGFYTWIYRIAFNLWISRRRRRRPEISTDQLHDASGQEPRDGIETPLQQLERQERIALIRVALEQLPSEHRSILILREMEGYDYETIAEMLDVALGTVRSRLHRARLQLKRQLELVLHEPS